MAGLDRRTFLRRAGIAALAGGTIPQGFELVRPSGSAGRSSRRLKALAKELRGPVFARSSSRYADAHRVYNSRFSNRHPLAVARPDNTADVQACIEWAHRYDVRVVPRAGGHSYAGYSTGQDALQIDLRRMDGVRVHSDSNTAVVGAGGRLMQVYAGLAEHGFTVPAGSCPTVGIAGLALGGGHGLASRKLGLTSDNIREVRMVLADGRRVTAKRNRHHDLLWACRGGGGGNFGIVTSFRFHIHRVDRATRFFLSWPWGDAEGVLAAWQNWAPHERDELDSILELSKDSAGLRVRCVGQFFGGSAELRDLLRPLTDVGRPYVSVQTEPYLDVQLWMAGCSGRSVSQCLAFSPLDFAAKSDYFRHPLPSDGRWSAVRAIENAPYLGRDASIIFDAYGGAINRVRPGATAFVHRNELFSAQYYASWGSRDAAHPMLRWLRDVHKTMRPYASGFAYQNYIDPELDHWRHAYYGSNWRRLVRVKAKYDPHNFFHFRQSIPAS